MIIIVTMVKLFAYYKLFLFAVHIIGFCYISLHRTSSCHLLLQLMAEKLIGSLFDMTAQNIWIPAMEFSASSYSGIEVSNATITPPVQREVPPEKTTAELLWICIGPCIFLTGVCGNILILVVMCQGRMKGTSTCVYLQAMALADLVVITTGVVPDWLTAQDIITLKEVHPVLCKMEKFLFYTSADTSIWACVIFTIDRFVAVCFPMDSMQRCPPQQAKFYAAATFIAATVKNFHVLFTRGQEWHTKNNETILFSNCGSPTEEYKYFEKYVRPWIAFTVVNLLPFCILVFCNLFIVRAMIRLRQSHRTSAIITSKDSTTVTQMTALCLSASICFLVCVTPSMILLIGKPYWSANSNPSYDIAKAAGNLIFYINHSINFFLYCMTGRKFRMELQSLVSKKSTTLGKSSTAARNSADLVMTYKMQRNRLGTTKGGKSGLYASAPCFTDFICKPLPSRSQYQTFLRDPGGNGVDRMKAGSDVVLMNCVGYESEHSLFSKESRI